MIWIIFSILVLLFIIFLLIAMIKIRKGRKIPTDYYNIFIIGIIWFAFGLIYEENYFFFIMGLIFMLIGLVNKDKWKKNHRTWKDLSKTEKKFKVGVIWILIVFVIFGFVALLIFENESKVDLSEQRAIEIASESDCINEGSLTDGIYYNDITKTWWINIDSDKEGCNPACVVSEDGTAEINWRCTGLIE